MRRRHIKIRLTNHLNNSFELSLVAVIWIVFDLLLRFNFDVLWGQIDSSDRKWHSRCRVVVDRKWFEFVLERRRRRRTNSVVGGGNLTSGGLFTHALTTCCQNILINTVHSVTHGLYRNIEMIFDRLLKLNKHQVFWLISFWLCSDWCLWWFILHR